MDGGKIPDLMAMLPFYVRGAWELALARIKFPVEIAPHLASRQASLQLLFAERPSLAPPGAKPWVGSPRVQREGLDWVERIAFVIPRVAAKVPWRTDCMIQAIAAQRWLGRIGLGSEIVIGFHRSWEGRMAPHAWLSYRGRPVIGHYTAAVARPALLASVPPERGPASADAQARTANRKRLSGDGTEARERL